MGKVKVGVLVFKDFEKFFIEQKRETLVNIKTRHKYQKQM